MMKLSVTSLAFVLAMVASSMAQTSPQTAIPNNLQTGINPALNTYNPYNAYNPYNPYNPYNAPNPYNAYNPYNPYNPYQSQFYQPGQNTLTGRTGQS